MGRHLANIFWLGTKELRSFGHDFVLLGLVIYVFSFGVYSEATSTMQELRDASVGIVDEDRSPLSRDIAASLLPPNFKPPQQVKLSDVDRLMDTAQYTFIIDIPPHFERDLQAGRRPAIQVDVDATAMMQAGIGAGYIENILSAEIARRAGSAADAEPPIDLAIRVAFNPNLSTTLFNSVMAIINNVTMLAIVLAGAAIVREREHGTMDHLLTMPLSPFEIALAKVWANGLVITIAAGLSLVLIVRGLLAVEILGSVPLFMAGVALYLFFATAIGVFLGTVVRSMPQLGLLFILIALPMELLSGGNTPLDSMPLWLQTIMQASPSTHFVSFAQAILYRGAGIAIVWPEFLAVGIIGLLFFGLALLRFRKVTGTPIA
jgi:ABC-2 type transport system permease protein